MRNKLLKLACSLVLLLSVGLVRLPAMDDLYAILATIDRDEGAWGRHSDALPPCDDLDDKLFDNLDLDQEPPTEVAEDFFIQKETPEEAAEKTALAILAMRRLCHATFNEIAGWLADKNRMHKSGPKLQAMWGDKKCSKPLASLLALPDEELKEKLHQRRIATTRADYGLVDEIDFSTTPLADEIIIDVLLMRRLCNYTYAQIQRWLAEHGKRVPASAAITKIFSGKIISRGCPGAASLDEEALAAELTRLGYVVDPKHYQLLQAKPRILHNWPEKDLLSLIAMHRVLRLKPEVIQQWFAANTSASPSPAAQEHRLRTLRKEPGTPYHELLMLKDTALKAALISKGVNFDVMPRPTSANTRSLRHDWTEKELLQLIAMKKLHGKKDAEIAAAFEQQKEDDTFTAQTVKNAIRMIKNWKEADKDKPLFYLQELLKLDNDALKKELQKRGAMV